MYCTPAMVVDYPSFLFELLDKRVIFVGLFVGGSRGEYVVAIGKFYELYDVGWTWGYVWVAISRGPQDVWSKFGHECARGGGACVAEEPFGYRVVLGFGVVVYGINESAAPSVFVGVECIHDVVCCIVMSSYVAFFFVWV